jgi:hypothetical protein
MQLGWCKAGRMDFRRMKGVFDIVAKKSTGRRIVD